MSVNLLLWVVGVVVVVVVGEDFLCFGYRMQYTHT